jgi:hypothetical protein
VGLVSGACFAGFGHQVICVDKDQSKIAAFRRGEMALVPCVVWCQDTYGGKLIDADIKFANIRGHTLGRELPRLWHLSRLDHLIEGSGRHVSVGVGGFPVDKPPRQG